MIHYLIEQSINVENILLNKEKRILFQIPFDLVRKNSITVISNDCNTGVRIFIKCTNDLIL